MLEELTKMISGDEPEQQEKQYFFFMEDLNFGCCCCWIVHEVNTHSQRELKRVTKKNQLTIEPELISLLWLTKLQKGIK